GPGFRSGSEPGWQEPEHRASDWADHHGGLIPSGWPRLRDCPSGKLHGGWASRGPRFSDSWLTTVRQSVVDRERHAGKFATWGVAPSHTGSYEIIVSIRNG